MAPSRTSPSIILIIDDDVNMRILMRQILELHDYEVLDASSGAEGVQRCQLARPDLVLLDAALPDLDGYTVARQIRAIPGLPWIPLIMLTLVERASDKIRGLEAGADEFLPRAVNGSELIARIRTLLHLKARYDEAHRRGDELSMDNAALQRQNTALRRVLDHYVSPEIAEIMLANPTRNLQLGGAPCRVSVLVADIRGFMKFSERHAPQQVLVALNSLWTRLVPLIFEMKGTFDKYIGDAIMAFYGAPLPFEDDALRATKTALAMQQALCDLRAESPLVAELGLGIAIVTGDAVVGNAGSEQVMDYTVIGDPANTAQRLQSLAKPGQILICDSTHAALRGQFPARDVGPLPVTGRSRPIKAYEVLSPA